MEGFHVLLGFVVWFHLGFIEVCDVGEDPCDVSVFVPETPLNIGNFVSEYYLLIWGLFLFFVTCHHLARVVLNI